MFKKKNKYLIIETIIDSTDKEERSYKVRDSDSFCSEMFFKSISELKSFNERLTEYLKNK